MRPNRAFTLIELLVVISIIALLIAILLPALTKARDAARVAMCGGNQRQIAIGLTTYSHDYEGWYAPGLAWTSGAYYQDNTPAMDPTIPTFTVGHLTSYFGHSKAKNGMKAGPLAIFMCPSRDKRINADLATGLSKNRLMMTYRVVAGTGNRTGGGNWHGWIVYTLTDDPAFGRPITRDAMAGQECDPPSRQPMAGDPWSPNGWWEPGYMQYYTTPSTPRPINNHEDMANILYLDGHVQGKSASDLTRRIDLYNDEDLRF